MTLSFNQKYAAIVEKDETFDHVFYTCVKTTGIFCRPSCTAKKPKPENVEFFDDSKTAILKGYRPCKVCKPLEKKGSTPKEIQNLIHELNTNPNLKLKDFHLRERGLDPVRIRRWFLKNHGMTFHAYQRMNKINTAFKKISKGENVTGTAFDIGFDSLSGFTDSFKKVFGFSPSKSKNSKVIDLTRIETPLGTMIACGVEDGICLLEFSDRKMLETELKDLAKRLNSTIVLGENPHFNKLRKQLDAYFEGKLHEFSIPLVTPGTDFQIQVWNELKNIKFGQTRSYKVQAVALGNAEAVRAVARANGMNRIAIIIPCHRVVGSDGQLTGYAGGLWRKQRLLELESGQLRIA